MTARSDENYDFMYFHDYLNHVLYNAKIKSEIKSSLNAYGLNSTPNFLSNTSAIRSKTRRLWEDDHHWDDGVNAPDPIKVLPEDLVDNILEVQLILRNIEQPHWKQLLKIIDYLKNQVKGHDYLTLTCWTICNYLLRRWPNMFYISNKALNHAQSSSQRQFIYELKRTGNKLRKGRSLPRYSKEVCLILSPMESVNNDERDNMIMEVNFLKREYRNIRFETIDVWNFKNTEEALSEVRGRKFDHIVFFGHGNETYGFVLNFKDNDDSYLDEERFVKISKHLRREESSVIILGCDGNVYEQREYSHVNRIYARHGFSDELAGYFLYGFFWGVQKGLDVKDCYDVGRTSLLLRSSAAYYIAFAKRR